MMNVHADVSSPARGQYFGQSLHLHPYLFVCIRSEVLARLHQYAGLSECSLLAIVTSNKILHADCAVC